MKKYICSLVVMTAFTGLVTAKDLQVDGFKKMVKESLLDKDRDSFYALFDWTGVHYIHRDHIEMFWEDPLKSVGENGKDFKLSEIEWVPVADFDKQQTLSFNTVRKVNGRSYEPTHPVAGLILVHFESEENEEGEGHGIALPVVVGKTAKGEFVLNSIKIVQEKDK